jgi:branched-chain amino acid transport system permease protein
VTGLLYRLVPAILNDLGVNGNISFIIFGAALLHALIGAPEGIAGQIIELSRKLGLARGDSR